MAERVRVGGGAAGRLPVEWDGIETDEVMRSQHENFDQVDDKMEEVIQEIVMARVISSVASHSKLLFASPPPQKQTLATEHARNARSPPCV
eukprot:828796-Rhodomonas_salina.1